MITAVSPVTFGLKIKISAHLALGLGPGLVRDRGTGDRDRAGGRVSEVRR